MPQLSRHATDRSSTGRTRPNASWSNTKARPTGFIQRYLFIDNPEWQSTLLAAGAPADGAGIDFFIGDVALIGMGMGPKMIDQFVETTWLRYPEVPAIVVNVSSENRRSWRALEKAGFVRLWSGLLESDDPSDEGLNHVYLCGRPESQSEGVLGARPVISARMAPGPLSPP